VIVTISPLTLSSAIHQCQQLSIYQLLKISNNLKQVVTYRVSMLVLLLSWRML